MHPTTDQPTTDQPTTDQPTTDLVLVLCGTGKTGRRVVDRLTAQGRAVRVGSRSGTPPFDWDDPATWPAALEGVAAVYVVYTPDLAFPGARARIGAFAAAADDAGVRRQVLLSGRGEPEAQRSEQAVRDAAHEWTVLRSSWFDQNFSESFLLDPVIDGTIALPAGDVAEPFVDADDVADCAVAALTDDRHVGRTYELTGPRLLTFREVAEELSAATGRSIGYVPVSAEEYVAAAVDHGVPPAEADAFAGLFTSVLDGRNASTTGDVERVLGRPPRDFTDFARSTAATGVWAVPDTADVR